MPGSSEYSELFTSLKDLLSKDDGKNIIIIAVGSGRCVEELERTCAELFKESWHRKLRFWKGRPRPPVYFCTPRNLPSALHSAESLCRERRRHRERSVAVVASRAVRSLDLRVGQQVRSLAVLGAKPAQTTAAPPPSPTLGSRHPASRNLTLRESSSFCNVPLAEWRRRQPSGYSLLTGPGVLVEAGTAAAKRWSSTPSSSVASPLAYGEEETGEERRRGAIRKHLEAMERRAASGRGPRGWRAPAAAILGVLAGGAAKGAVVAAATDADGLTFRDDDKEEGGAMAPGGVGMKETLVAAGFGLAAGTTAAALLVYVVPWEAFFGHLRGLLASWWAWICDLFSRLQDAVRSFRARVEEVRRGGRKVVRMKRGGARSSGSR
ncbi:hypothetical protein ISF_06851 [Cordyceps fumosorosea ARSEF 2679]|uniref:Uncharacterized protein n=1 Tax=Cordyceps fumosorosea (strain ARSEF 2679) TaxID=1081104 RepID=A0A167R6C3_CORFA|nr:hypothetical protein ISF_06851 [Cordyceps fumosorosea ARSEF 2679]OAA58312.1 hypothetical protein ISF_06851 [Cordyceps fumosorosea ARSEF 2679]